MNWPDGNAFDHAVLMENIANGQRILRYLIEAPVNGRWTGVTDGVTVGHQNRPVPEGGHRRCGPG